MSRSTWVVVVARIGEMRWAVARGGGWRHQRCEAELRPGSGQLSQWHQPPHWWGAHIGVPGAADTNVRCSRGGKYSENWWVHLAGAVFWALAVLSAQGCECWPSVRLTPSQARTGRVMGTRALCNDAGDTSPANKESPMCFTPSSIHLISAMQTWWRKWMLFRNNQRKMLYCYAECWADTKSSFHSVV